MPPNIMPRFCTERPAIKHTDIQQQQPGTRGCPFCLTPWPIPISIGDDDDIPTIRTIPTQPDSQYPILSRSLDSPRTSSHGFIPPISNTMVIAGRDRMQNLKNITSTVRESSTARTKAINIKQDQKPLLNPLVSDVEIAFWLVTKQECIQGIVRIKTLSPICKSRTTIYYFMLILLGNFQYTIIWAQHSQMTLTEWVEKVIRPSNQGQSNLPWSTASYKLAISCTPSKVVQISDYNRTVADFFERGGRFDIRGSKLVSVPLFFQESYDSDNNKSPSPPRRTKKRGRQNSTPIKKEKVDFLPINPTAFQSPPQKRAHHRTPSSDFFRTPTPESPRAQEEDISRTDISLENNPPVLIEERICTEDIPSDHSGQDLSRTEQTNEQIDKQTKQTHQYTNQTTKVNQEESHRTESIPLISAIQDQNQDPDSGPASRTRGFTVRRKVILHHRTK